MALSSGARLGPYEIVSLVGAGGMGEVYRAHDPRLGRDIAIKILPTTNLDLRRRFDAEARALAALNHPHIVTIHSVEEADGISFLTMELIDGRSLTDLIPKRGLPADRLLALAIPLADALASAHAKGITHRDLKPANVMMTPAGRIKVLDFGLAKLCEAVPTGESAATLPTQIITSAGSIVGTVAYMSPEQAEGKPADPRSDVFSLGIMLYEMATGARPFTGETSIAIISSIVKDTPKLVSEVNPSLPWEMSRVIRKALAKDPAHRYQSATDLRNDLEDLKHDLESVQRSAPLTITRGHRRRSRWPWQLLIVSSALALVAATFLWRVRGFKAQKDRPTGLEMRFDQLTSEGNEYSATLSPDGQWILYVSDITGRSAIYLRSVGGRLAINLTKDSTLDNVQPAFSPDGQRIAFRSERDSGGIFIMGRTGESVQRLTDFGFNPTWSPTGEEIAFADEPGYQGDRTRQSALWIVTVATGEKRLVTQGDAVQPHWSPHGYRLAYWAVPFGAGGGGQRDIWTVSVRGGSAVRVTDDPAVDWNPTWSPDGSYLYFLSNRGGSMNVWRVPISEASGKVLGQPEAVTTPAQFVQHFSFAADGRRLAYDSIVDKGGLYSINFDSLKKVVTGEPLPISMSSMVYMNPNISPDGKWVAFQSFGGQEDIYISRLGGTELRQLTNDTAKDRVPRWSPDGQRIAFYSDRRGKYNIWTIHVDGSHLEQVTGDAMDLIQPVWSPDGSRMAVTDEDAGIVYIIDPRVSANRQRPQEMPKYPGGRRFMALSWSQDATQLAGVLLPFDTGGIVTYDLESQKYHTASDFGSGPVWLKDSRAVLFVWQSKLFLAAPARKARELLSVSPDYITSFTIDRDNRQLLFSRYAAESNVWLATLR